MFYCILVLVSVEKTGPGNFMGNFLPYVNLRSPHVPAGTSLERGTAAPGAYINTKFSTSATRTKFSIQEGRTTGIRSIKIKI
jgi:hypothetical protein